MYSGLVLCGNSTNALVSLGALQLLLEKNYLRFIKNYYCTSSGSVIAVLLIIGYTPLEIVSLICYHKAFQKIGFMNLCNPFLGKSLFNFDHISDFLKLLICRKIGYIPTMLQIKEVFDVDLMITSYNVTDDEKVYITHHNFPDLCVVQATRMSSSFPLIFEPVKFENKLYVDGGLVDNFPVEVTGNDRCIGIITKNPVEEIKELNSMSSLFMFMINLFLVFVNTSSFDKINRSSNCDVLVLTAKLNSFNFTSKTNEILKLFDNGYSLCQTEIKVLMNNDQMEANNDQMEARTVIETTV